MLGKPSAVSGGILPPSLRAPNGERREGPCLALFCAARSKAAILAHSMARKAVRIGPRSPGQLCARGSLARGIRWSGCGPDENVRTAPVALFGSPLVAKLTDVGRRHWHDAGVDVLGQRVDLRRLPVGQHLAKTTADPVRMATAIVICPPPSLPGRNACWLQPFCSQIGGKRWTSVDAGDSKKSRNASSGTVGGRWRTMVEDSRTGFTRMRSQVQVLHRPPIRIWSGGRFAFSPPAGLPLKACAPSQTPWKRFCCPATSPTARATRSTCTRGTSAVRGDSSRGVGRVHVAGRAAPGYPISGTAHQLRY